MTTNYEAYQHAIERLTVAAAALDQAKASMMDAQIGTTPPPITHLGDWYGITHLVKFTDGLIYALKHEDCEDCGHALSMHGDKYGCEYERGDIEMTCRDGGTIMAAAGPCSCRWGQQEAKH